MCGILGVIWKREPEFGIDRFKQLLEVQAHRGPDQLNYEIFKKVFLGHNRLSIVDLQHSSQPMWTSDGRYCIIYNGEIYNYKDLTNTLVESNVHYDPNSDTSVLLNGYVYLGQSFLQSINGMFSFAIYDKLTNTVELVRDRLGKKPLFYAMTDFGLIFASTTRAIIKSDLVTRKIDKKALFYYLQYGFVPDNHCIFEEINKVGASEIITIKQDTVDIQKFWEIPTKKKISTPFSRRKKLNFLVESAVDVRYRQSDVTVATFLSGGTDSSGVSSILQKSSSDKLKAFHMVPDSNEYDESSWAKKVAFAAQLNLNIQKSEISNTLNELIIIAQYLDEPLGDSSALPTYEICKRASKDVKVVMSGEGGDELFLGYDWQRKFIKTYFLRSVLNVLGLKIRKPLSIKNKSFRKVRVFLNLILLDHASAYEFLFSGGNSEVLPEYLSAEFNVVAKNFNNKLVKEKFTSQKGDLFQKMLNVDLKHYLCADLLVKVDTMSMASSIEIRSPLLDYRLIEYSASTPFLMKLFNPRKSELKSIFKKYLPDEITRRTDKRGFSINKNVRIDEDIKTFLIDYLRENSQYMKQYFDIKNITVALNKKIRSTFENDLIWNILMFILWMKKIKD